jgi:hypothetical protein
LCPSQQYGLFHPQPPPHQLFGGLRGGLPSGDSDSLQYHPVFIPST